MNSLKGYIAIGKIKRIIMKNKTVLVTGGTGSFGKKFIQTLLRDYSPKKIIVYSRDELKQYQMQQSLPFAKHHSIMRYFIGDIRDLARLSMAMEGVDYVIHTAALKQVTTAEYNPFEAVKTNILGSQNIIDAAFKTNVEKIIALSTDKAAAPINLYGATKLASDKLFVASNNSKGNRKIKISVVRYGNVMGSRGSVIPFFLNEKDKGVLPITDKRMTRFNITLEEGVDFVLKCLDRMWGGEIFVPKIPSYNILDIAEAIAPGIEHKFIGIRAGEKLHEEMITIDDAINTIEFKDYFVILPSTKLWNIKEFINQSSSSKGEFCKYGFSYSSGKNENFLTVKVLAELIKRM